MRLRDQLKHAARLVREGQARFVLDEVRRRLSSDTLAFGLRRDLTVPFQAPTAKIPLTVRPLRDNERSVLSVVEAADAADRRERTARLRMLDAGFGVCYAIVNSDDEVCYVQWLMGSGDNDAVQDFYEGLFPVLGPGEMLLEGAYTFSAFRGLGVMGHGMARLAEIGADQGGRSAITFVGQENVPSLKGCERAGFFPVLVRKDHRRLFRATVTFDPIAAEAPGPSDKGDDTTSPKRSSD